MSAYDNFIQDFPIRCSEILRDYEKMEEFEGREVTFLLAIAAAGLTVPAERLKQKTEHSDIHQSGDRKKFLEATEKYDELCLGAFLPSCIWLECKGDLYFGDLSSVVGNPDSWPEMQCPKKISEYKQTKTILKHIRNALSHGNIYSYKNPIERIIFLSKPNHQLNKFNYLSITPSDFAIMLKNWFKFLKDLKLPKNAQETTGELYWGLKTGTDDA